MYFYGGFYMKKDNLPTKKRSLHWALIIYPDSVNQDYIQILDDYHIKWAESPWHDRDINADGTPKKIHKHLILIFESLKSWSQVNEVALKIGSPSPELVHAPVGYVRYLVHADNPEKAQYEKKDIVGHNGFDVDYYFDKDEHDFSISDEIVAIICDTRIDNFIHLRKYLLAHEMREHLRYINTKGIYVTRAYLDAQYQLNKEEGYDRQTGEIRGRGEHHAHEKKD